MAAKHVGVLVCPHVFESSRPVLQVSNRTGDLQFLCGDDHGPGQRPRVVGISHVLEKDGSLKEIVSLPVGWWAERERVGRPWTKAKI